MRNIHLDVARLAGNTAPATAKLSIRRWNGVLDDQGAKRDPNHGENNLGKGVNHAASPVPLNDHKRRESRQRHITGFRRLASGGEVRFLRHKFDLFFD